MVSASGCDMAICSCPPRESESKGSFVRLNRKIYALQLN